MSIGGVKMAHHQRINRMNNPINRVKCVVDSCTYWDNGNKCMAENIEIQPPQAMDTQETDCVTFLPRDFS